ncbi:hypothetical protein TOPH_04342 [Tolypocladium ophioglossoides CBS 100239]|uniref:Uncharacterized protein n=1 Tax=Tolypocladium ophioglossoides (strain CBS 100239) TaxID=1163406 RepID=A0A0L0NAS9_TOLOC|nr:hypothetical protein TOPH_04342 [Tolypocladium ophioglossoides CBS 100239]
MALTNSDMANASTATSRRWWKNMPSNSSRWDPSPRVFAILGWEYSGFYLGYWKYCKALQRRDREGSWIRDRVVEALKRCFSHI